MHGLVILHKHENCTGDGPGVFIFMPPPTLGSQRHYLFSVSVHISKHTNLINAITEECMKGIHSKWVEVHVLTMI